MKKKNGVFRRLMDFGLRFAVAAALCLGLLCSLISASAPGVRGDVNGSGAVDLRDATTLTRYVSNAWQGVEIHPENADVNGDGILNASDVDALRHWLAGDRKGNATSAALDGDLAHYTVLSASVNENGVSAVSFQYGTSTLGRALTCWCLSPETWDRTVLLNFEIHGFEDEYERDGAVLVALAHELIETFSFQSDLHGCRLLVIPECNPDGLEAGTTNNGFGRCNAEEIDLNRDFDASHIAYTCPRNYSPAPFSAVESRAMRDLVLRCHPAVVIDFHGWENCTIGSSALAEAFSLHDGLNHKNVLTENAHGYFSYWAQLQGAEALLVEFRNSSSVDADALCATVEEILAGNYGSGATAYSVDEAYARYPNIQAYAKDRGRVIVQREVGGSELSYGYIDGANDCCTIRQVYENGWCKVLYPLTNGYTKTGFCKVESFFDTADAVTPYQCTVPANTPIYRDRERSVRIGSVWSTDIFTVIAETEGLCQIIYPLDSGGYKLGWIEASLPGQNRSYPAPFPACSVSSVAGRPGDIVTVPIVISGEPELVAARLRIGYDQHVLTLTEAKDGGLLGSNQFCEDRSACPYTVLWENGKRTGNIRVNGTLLTLRFRISPDAAAGTYPITLSGVADDFYGVDLNTVSILLRSGSVTVSGAGCLRGDANGDGTVDSRDAVYLLRYLAGWTLPEAMPEAMDVDANQGIDSRDAVHLLRYLAGWDIELH